MFQQYLDVPSQWKMAYVTPIHKSGRKSDAQDNWPVSLMWLMSVVDTVMEHILTSDIMQYFGNEWFFCLPIYNLVLGQGILVNCNFLLLQMILPRPWSGNSKLILEYLTYQKHLTEFLIWDYFVRLLWNKGLSVYMVTILKW